MLKEKSFLLSLLIFLSVLGWATANTGGQVAAKVYVDPAITAADPDETFTVDVKIANVKNLWDYEFRLSWDPALLDVTKVTEGSFLNAEDTYSTFFVKKEDFPSVGNLYVVCTLMGEPRTATASGSGTLATVEFLVKEEGNSSLHLYETLLEDYDRNKMPHTTEDGYFQTFPPSQILVEPPSIIDPSLVPGSTFNVSISVVEAAEVYSWSLNMKWEPTLLNVTEGEEGPFLNQEGAYNTVFNFQIDQEEGNLYANCSLVDSDIWASGNGTLIIITFLAEAEGISALDLFGTLLVNYQGEEVLHVARSGYFENLRPRIRDVAVVSVVVSPEEVRAGDSVSVSVVAKNEGEIAEGFDIEIYYNASFLGRIGVSNLSADTEKTLTFSWSTKGLSEGKYAIEAVASPVSGEMDTTDNAYVYEYLVVTPSEQSFPFMLIITILVVVILVVFAGFLLLRKRG